MDQVAGLGCNQTDLLLCLTTSSFINSSSVGLRAYSVPGSVPLGLRIKKEMTLFLPSKSSQVTGKDKQMPTM